MYVNRMISGDVCRKYWAENHRPNASGGMLKHHRMEEMMR